MNANTLLADPAAIEIEKFVSRDAAITIVVRPIQPSADCPQCRQPSSSLKTRYLRRLADLPWHNMPIQIELHARKFRCRNELCPVVLQELLFQYNRPVSSSLTLRESCS